MMQRAQRFQRTAAPFIFFTAVPYMIRVIAYGNLNAFAYACFKDDVHRAVRLYDLFEHDNYLVALAEHSAKAPAGTCSNAIMLSCVLLDEYTLYAIFVFWFLLSVGKAFFF